MHFGSGKGRWGGFAHGPARGEYAWTATHKSRSETNSFPPAKFKDKIQSWELPAGCCPPARLSEAKLHPEGSEGS